MNKQCNQRKYTNVIRYVKNVFSILFVIGIIVVLFSFSSLAITLILGTQRLKIENYRGNPRTSPSKPLLLLWPNLSG